MVKRKLIEDWCPDVWDRVHRMTWLRNGYPMCSICGYVDDPDAVQFYDEREEYEQEDPETDAEASQA